MKHEATPRVEEITVREIAVEAGADPRSVRKVLRGEDVRGVAGVRIRRALEKRHVRIDPRQQ